MEHEQSHTTGLSRLMEHSHSMLEHAEAGDWDTVIRDEATRRELINAFFSKPSNIANEPDISTAIQELLQINDKLEKLTTDARDKAKVDGATISKGREAVNAYTENAG